MKIGSVFPDLLTPLDTTASIDDKLARTLVEAEPDPDDAPAAKNE